MTNPVYQALLLDHFRNPRNKRKLEAPTHQGDVRNPLCGDTIEMELRCQQDQLLDLAFEGKGCAVSQASASCLTSVLKEKTIPEALALEEDFKTILEQESVPDEILERVGDLVAFRGLLGFPTRHRCALLSWKAFHAARETPSTAE